MSICDQCERCRALSEADFDINKLLAAKRSRGILKRFRSLIISCCYKLGLIQIDGVENATERIYDV